MCRCVVLCLVGLLIFTVDGYAQPQHGFRISFTDKGGTTQSLSNPTGFLSQRAIDRRSNQNIAIDSTDLPVSPAYMDSVLSLTGGKLHMTSKWFNYTVILLNDSSKILELQGKPFINDIKYIAYYASGLHKASKTNTENTPLITAKTTGSSAYYGDAYNQTSIVNGDYLHDKGWKGQGKLIAVLDEGFNDVNTAPAFDSMMNSGRLIDQYNYVDANNNVFINSSHGTISLSLMAGNLPGTYVGTAPLADYALYNTEIRGSEQRIEMDNIVAAAERADSVGADIITISLGYNWFELPTKNDLTYADIDGKSTIAAKAANMATTKGILFVASAGNEGGGSWNYILTPGDADSAITVGNVGLSKAPSGTSGYGPNSAGTIKPDVCLVGQPAAVMRSSTTPFPTSGTSVSTPQLAGWAACLMQASNKLTPYDIRTAIQKSAHMYTTPTAQLGYGIPNFHYALNLLNVEEPKKLPNNGDWLTVSPNPFTEQVSVSVYRERGTSLNIQLTDISGKVMYANQFQLSTGTQTIQINLPELSRGIYILKAIADDELVTQKLIKR